MNIYGILNMEMRKLKRGRDVCGERGSAGGPVCFMTLTVSELPHTTTLQALCLDHGLVSKKSTLLWGVLLR